MAIKNTAFVAEVNGSPVYVRFLYKRTLTLAQIVIEDKAIGEEGELEDIEVVIAAGQAICSKDDKANGKYDKAVGRKIAFSRAVDSIVLSSRAERKALWEALWDFEREEGTLTPKAKTNNLALAFDRAKRIVELAFSGIPRRISEATTEVDRLRDSQEFNAIPDGDKEVLLQYIKIGLREALHEAAKKAVGLVAA